MIVHCPSCDLTHDTADNQIGEYIHCRCGQWLRVGRRMNGTRYAIVVNQPPVSWPKEKR